MMSISLAGSIVALASAYISQYGFGLVPCELCLAQRIPYFLVIALSLLCFSFASYPKTVFYLIVIALLTGSGIAFYHAGVEKHLFQGPTACTSTASEQQTSLQDLRNRILHAPVIACDQPQWEFYGVTMAALNCLYSLVLALITYQLGKKRYA